MNLTKQDIFKRLNEITSYFSFGRILGYISFQETIGLDNFLKRSLLCNAERLITSERSLLVGLWMHNVKLDKQWPIGEDDAYLKEIYSLMNELHSLYKPSYFIPLNQQLKEIAFYEGDGGYYWQFVHFAFEKYDDIIFRDFLIQDYNYDIRAIESTFFKIKRCIEKQIEARISLKAKRKEYISPISAFTISPKALKEHFNNPEISIIDALSFEIGVRTADKIEDISDRNIFSLYPIIKLPNERGYFILDVLTLSLSMNETPYYWIMDSNNFNSSLIGNIRGGLAEKIVYNILLKRFSCNDIYRNVLIKRSRSSDVITDIDLLLIHNNTGIVFQVKSKRLTELSKQGDADAIDKDFKAAIIDAYDQGVKCIDCLKNSQQYYSLRKNIPNVEDMTLINVCITLDQYPTLSSISWAKSSIVTKDDIPLLAMSIYDLDCLLSLLSMDEFVDYLNFRTKEVYGIYGINEMYYLGVFLMYYMGKKVHLSDKIPREYAILVDNVLLKSKRYGYKINKVQDICDLLEKYPINQPIRC